MKARWLIAMLSLACAPLVAAAQMTMQDFSGEPGPQRAFALVVGSTVQTIDGPCGASAKLNKYAQQHPGTYIVFVQDGDLYRLDASVSLTKAKALYAPMRSLMIRQAALAAEQVPLAHTQRALGEEQRTAVDPGEKGRIGAAQGAIGQQQGAIGELQGQIGREQGLVGRTFYRHVEAMLNDCVANHSCTRVSVESAQRW